MDGRRGMGRIAKRSRVAWLAWAGIVSVCGGVGVFGCEDDSNDIQVTAAAGAAGMNNFGGGAGTGTGTGGGISVIPLKEAKLNIEHNATDRDTGFQGFIDADGWKTLRVTGPEGTVLTLQGQGKLGTLGLTELFFESVEPENAEVPITEVLSTLPEGEYTIEGQMIDGQPTRGTALLTHDIPAGPVLVAPEEGATVPTTGLVMRWNPVTLSLTGEPVTIVAYQLIIEKDDEPDPHAITKPDLSIYVGPNLTQVTVPDEFLQPDTDYAWEVLAIEESGNQTLSSGEFSTE